MLSSSLSERSSRPEKCRRAPWSLVDEVIKSNRGSSQTVEQIVDSQALQIDNQPLLLLRGAAEQSRDGGRHGDKFKESNRGRKEAKQGRLSWWVFLIFICADRKE